MAKDSGIEWCTHTQNLWWGCTKVDEGCRHCYAEDWMDASQYWGKTAPRRFFKEAHYRQPLPWDRAAARAGERHRVFCGSMMDLFEKHSDLAISAKMECRRSELFCNIIPGTPNLDWLLLTKRLENVLETVPVTWRQHWPQWVWLGFSASNQAEFGRGMNQMRAIINDLSTFPPVVFVSLEPLLGKIIISKAALDVLDWVIVGGESGSKARPMYPEWVRGLRDQATSAGVPFFFKQWGSAKPDIADVLAWKHAGRDFSRPKGGNILDGQVWQQFPEVQS